MPRSGCSGGCGAAAGGGDGSRGPAVGSGDKSRGGKPAADELSDAEVPSDAKPGSRGAWLNDRGRLSSRGSAGVASIHRVDFRGAAVDAEGIVGGALGACFCTGGAERDGEVPWPMCGWRDGPARCVPDRRGEAVGVPNCGIGDGARSWDGPRPAGGGPAGTGSPRVQPWRRSSFAP